MTLPEVLAGIEALREPRGEAHYAKLGLPLRGYGVGLTKLRKLAKSAGRDNALSDALWATDLYEARIIALLVEDPKRITRAAVEARVATPHFCRFVHVYASCDSVLARSPVARPLAVDWAGDPDPLRRRIAYLLLGELAGDAKDKALTDAFFLPYIAAVRLGLQGEENYVRDAMNAFLLYVGQRNAVLHAAALSAAAAIGKVVVDYGDNSCEAPDVTKHLSGARIRQKVGAA